MACNIFDGTMEIFNYGLTNVAKKLANPILFSQHYKIDPKALRRANLIDPILNADTSLFVDPLLLSQSSNVLIRKNAYALLRSTFDKVVRLLAVCNTEGDAAWKAAQNILDLKEAPETGLGFGNSGTSGSSRPEEVQRRVLRTTREIIQLGEKDPEIISLMGMFDKGVGPDTISDTTTKAIMPVLAELTEKFCNQQGISTQSFEKYAGRKLPNNPYRNRTPVILVPRDIVRELPLAVSWSDVSDTIRKVDEVREGFNRLVGRIAQATITERKMALRDAALSSLDRFQEFFRSVLAASEPYDPNADVLGYYAFREVMARDAKAFKADIPKPTQKNAAELKRIVEAIIHHFTFMVENNNLWELLWDGSKPKREKASQLLFFAVSDMFCKANDIDISPETHAGGGPVDFKFSSGYANRLVVEIKLSKGAVVDGYKSQLEIYKTASNTDAGILLVINVGHMGQKLGQIRALKEAREKAGQRASDIFVVNGLRRPSASVAKRKGS